MASRERTVERREQAVDEAKGLLDTLTAETSVKHAQETAKRIYERVDDAVKATEQLELGGPA